MAHRVQKRVVSASLLPHKGEQIFVIAGILADREFRRCHARSFEPKAISAWNPYRRKIEFIIVLEVSTPRRGFKRTQSHPDEGWFTRAEVFDAEESEEAFFGENDSLLCVGWLIPRLIQADVGVLAQDSRAKKH